MGGNHLLKILLCHKILNNFKKISFRDLVIRGHKWSHMVTFNVPSYIWSQHWLYQSRNLHFHCFLEEGELWPLIDLLGSTGGKNINQSIKK